MTKEKLEICPFCGSAVKLIDDIGILISCVNTNCVIRVEVDGLPKEQAIAAWNTRSCAGEG